MNIHDEKAFEEAIEQHLLEHGEYTKLNATEYDRELAFFPTTVIQFLKDSQPDEWSKLASIHGSAMETKLLQRLVKELDKRGMLDVLRHGFVDFGVRFKMAYFKPASGMNPDTQKLYDKNIPGITRQVHYSVKSEHSIDMLLSLNGLPVATVELKNPFTRQTVEHAKKQYIHDRDPRELLFQFKKRALVHFAVDPDQVYMTTKLLKGKTTYLLFNKGYNRGAGNPPVKGKHKTFYLWEYVWAKESWLDILGRFLHLQIEEIKIDGTFVKKESLIFPRYHQLDVVRELAADVRKNGPGKNYLIEHSAGSGKSNSIAWLAYRLSNLHNARDERIFDSVIVVTDRLVLDQQLQNTIYQFEHKQGVVQKIDENSTQLADALATGINIIITTLQKFPYVIDKIGLLPQRNYAIIVDEAHSSQGGQSTTKMKEALTVIDMSKSSKVKDKKEKFGKKKDVEEVILKTMKARGPHDNLSYFGFTATPKAKTLRFFGIHDEKTDHYKPFHLYSMRQAIEEGFILDVLKNYTTYKTFFKLNKAIEKDPQFNKKKANRAIARFVSLHPHNLSQKTEVIIEHFRHVTMKKIGEKAKAMVVTSSRAHVVRYWHEFQKYIKEKQYKDIKLLVAFSGKVSDEYGNCFTEQGINKIKERQVPEKFGSNEYNLLLVAEKYQTGFDQPLLHTMYVDKKLSGIKAVQTLSRLNRTFPGKEDTFILDFVNETEEIQAAFQPYYEQTILTEDTDPNHLYDLKHQLDEAQIYWQSEIDQLCEVFFKPKEKRTTKDHGALYACVEPAVQRFRAIEKEEDKENFKHTLTVFLRLYSFLAQVMPFQDMELEKFYAYGKLLNNKLPKTGVQERLKLDDEVSLEYYRLQKINENINISLQENSDGEMSTTREAGIRKGKEEKAFLSEIIAVLNERFATDFTEADRLFFDQIVEDCIEDETLSKQAKSNTIDNFKYGFKDVFINKLIDRMDQNQDIFTKIMDNKEFQDVVFQWMLMEVYRKINK